ncbi:hypothetical protein KJA14_01950 [Patescibacteria group bacterium]|nr:hypothetical protein [Patescibacteria group bacterium]
MAIEKNIGWGLLVLGIFLIVWPLFTSYNIFTGKTQVPVIFQMEEKNKTSLPEEKKSDLTPEEMEKIVEEKLGEIFPVEFLVKLSNLTSWSVFVGILIFAGSQISGLGIKLIKK